MCIAIPMRVVESQGLRALCEHGGELRTVDLSLVGAQPPGTWVLTFLDAAREVISERSARRTLDALRALEAAMGGEPVAMESLFADLLEREPPLPEHLQPVAANPRAKE